MFHGVRYEKIPNDIIEETDGDAQEGDEEKEGGEAVIYLRPPAGRERRSCRGKHKTWLRIIAALVLLAIVLGFVVCEWSGCGTEEQGGGETQTAHSDKDGEGHEHHHHHHHQNTGDNDDDDDDDDDDGDHDHDNDSEEHSDHHSHFHSGSLFHHAAIVTGSATCSRAAMKLLQDGGNLVDAGIAALLCLGVVHPHTASIGGTFSALFYNHTTGSLKAIQPSSPQSNLKTYGIPAILPGVKRFHAQYGNVEWARLFEDAIRLARDGFQIDHILASALLTNKSRIVQSKLCMLFCDESGRVKSVGSNVTNGNLSELLRSVSLNDSHFPEILAMKLAEDLSPAERPDFVRDVRRVTGEINDPLIAREEKYSLLAGSCPFSGSVLSDALERAAKLIHSLHNRTDLNSSAPSLLSLLEFAKEIYNTSQAGENGSLAEGLAVSGASSLIGVMHRQGHFLVISASLNSSWGSGLLLPSSGVVLSNFIPNVSASAPILNFPLVVRIKNTDDDDDDDEEEDEEVQIIAVTGGLSALLNAAQILTNRLERGMSAEEAVQAPLLHVALQRGSQGSVTVCTSSRSNSTDTDSAPLPERGVEVQPTDRCSEGDATAMLLQVHAGHVGVYGAPTFKTHTDGF